MTRESEILLARARALLDSPEPAAVGSSARLAAFLTRQAVEDLIDARCAALGGVQRVDATMKAKLAILKSLDDSRGGGGPGQRLASADRILPPARLPALTDGGRGARAMPGGGKGVSCRRFRGEGQMMTVLVGLSSGSSAPDSSSPHQLMAATSPSDGRSRTAL